MKKVFDGVLVAVSLVLVAISRLPFLGDGYGTDPDAGRVAITARLLAETGKYQASRLPGYPVQEFTCALAWRGGPTALNSLTAFLGVLAVLFLILTLRRLGIKLAILAGLALASVPIIAVSSTCTMDYVWALAFISMAWYCATFRSWPMAILAGIALGLATGCRITSLAMAVPLLIFVWDRSNAKHSFKRIALAAITALVTALICFAPVLMNYGLKFWWFVETPVYPSVEKLVAFFTILTWGVSAPVVMVSLALAFLNGLIRMMPYRQKKGGRVVAVTTPLNYRWKEISRLRLSEWPILLDASKDVTKWVKVAWVPGVAVKIVAWARRFAEEPLIGNQRRLFWAAFVGIVVFAGIFLRLPQEAAYLIPVIFCAIILISFAPRAIAIIIYVILTLAPFHDKIMEKLNWAPPYAAVCPSIWVDRDQRRLDAYEVGRLISLRDRSEKTLVVAGWWLPKIEVTLGHNPNTDEVVYVYLINQKGLDKYRGEGYQVIAGPGIAWYCSNQLNIDLSK